MRLDGFRRKYRLLTSAMVPVSDEPAVNLFEGWKPHRKFAKALDRPVPGTLISNDRHVLAASGSLGLEGINPIAAQPQ